MRQKVEWPIRISKQQQTIQYIGTKTPLTFERKKESLFDAWLMHANQEYLQTLSISIRK